MPYLGIPPDSPIRAPRFQVIVKGMYGTARVNISPTRAGVRANSTVSYLVDAPMFASLDRLRRQAAIQSYDLESRAQYKMRDIWRPARDLP